MELSPLLVVKIIHLVDRTDLFKIGNLVYGRREIVTSLYSGLEGTDRQRRTVNDGYSELAGLRLSVSKLMAYGTF